MTSPPPEIDLWDAARARVSAAGLWRVYDEVRGDGDSFDDLAGRGVRPDCARAGFRLSVARCDHEIVGTPTGSSASGGSPGPTGWRRRCPRRSPTTWVGGHFELVDLAVLESHRRHGGGRRLHDVLMDGETRRALLSTDDADTPAVLLRRAAGSAGAGSVWGCHARLNGVTRRSGRRGGGGRRSCGGAPGRSG